MESIFRILVIGGALLSIVFWSIPYFDYMWLTDEELQILDLGGFGSKLPQSPIYYWGTLVLWLVISVGLLFYKRIARTAFIACMSFFAATSLVGGISVLSPTEVLITTVITLSDGALIAIMYLTSISGKFSEKI